MSVTDMDIHSFPALIAPFDSYADKTSARCSCDPLAKGETEAHRGEQPSQGHVPSPMLSPLGRRELGSGPRAKSESLVGLEPRGSSCLALSWPLVMVRIRE